MAAIIGERPMTDSQRSRGTYDRRAAARVCVDCGKEPASPGLLTGDICRGKARIRWQADMAKRHTCVLCGRKGHHSSTCTEEGYKAKADPTLVRCALNCGAMLWASGKHAGDTVANHRCRVTKLDPEARPGPGR